MTALRTLSCLLALAFIAGCSERAAPPPAARPPSVAASEPTPAPSDVPAITGDLTVEPGMDRPGSDYRDFDLDAPDPERCRDACRDDEECRAYTYVAPGVQGDSARCWLKNPAPDPEPNECCTSGAR